MYELSSYMDFQAPITKIMGFIASEGSKMVLGKFLLNNEFFGTLPLVDLVGLLWL